LSIDHHLLTRGDTLRQDHLRTLGDIHSNGPRLNIERCCGGSSSIVLAGSCLRTATTFCAAATSARTASTTARATATSRGIRVSRWHTRLYHKDEATLRSSLQRRRWNHNRIRTVLQNQTHVHELVREQSLVPVVEYSLGLHGARRRINLVV
jgi:hypothetical protein